MLLLFSESCACVWHVRFGEILVIPLEFEAWPMEIAEVIIMMVFPMESETLAIEIIEMISDGMRNQPRPIETVDIALVTQL